jgi:uncharacterized protein (DUF736 family)
MEQKNNTGAIFKNERKEHERQPDYRGTAMIRGQKTDISLWINESKTGVKYFGATFSDPYKPEDGESDIKKQR